MGFALRVQPADALLGAFCSSAQQAPRACWPPLADTESRFSPHVSLWTSHRL